MELLSPAKNIQTAIVAINCGADAVYIGASDFGARKMAANNLNDIEKLVEYAHFYRAKVYVTLNTILYDNELENARNLIYSLYNIGVDALIIQDLGILEMDIPPIELHASTQTNNYDINRIKFLDQLGFKRIVLARESSLEHIKEVRKSINAEIECFIHGALCVSFSGQCYMSARIGGRSANRGECAQACRLKYSLLNNEQNVLIKDSYLLSLKDLNMTSKIQSMIDLGVNSLKIEGRLKDIPYVANVTAHYRKLLDNILEKRVKLSSGKCYYDFTPDTSKAFNRGFTQYFAENNNDKLANFISPKFCGNLIGKLSMKRGNQLKINTNSIISNGDGMCYIFNNQLYGFRVDKIENDIIYATTENNLSVGMDIYRNFDTVFQKQLENTKTLRKISVDLKIYPSKGGFKIYAIDEDNIETEHFTQNELQKANNIDRAIQNIDSSLRKGGDLFNIQNVDINFDEIPFLPNSVINESRREVLSQLKSIREKKFYPKPSSKPSENVNYFEKSGDYKLNVSNKLSRKFYKNHGCEITQEAFELLKNTNGLEVMTTKYCIRRECGFCPKECKNVPKEWKSESFNLVGPYQTFALSFDCKNCVMRIFAKR
ncbi:MAG: U32 family peptidase [Bacteroidales bacterium]|nr:U32 family peptidase [Bacteroidales bacterium]